MGALRVVDWSRRRVLRVRAVLLLTVLWVAINTCSDSNTWTRSNSADTGTSAVNNNYSYNNRVMVSAFSQQVASIHHRRQRHRATHRPRSWSNGASPKAPAHGVTGSSALAATTPDGDSDDNKFGFGQRIESVKCLLVGGISGSVASAPFSAIHDILLDSNTVLAQWEFDTDAAAAEAALFAIVYRYAIRQDDNPQLNSGVTGAFVVVRTLSRLRIPAYCSALPVQCGPPLGYLDWQVLGQLALNGIESAIIFGAATTAMDWAMEKKYISKFPG